MSQQSLFDIASDAYAKNDFEEAFKAFLNAAEQGEVDSMVMVSNMYGAAEGVAFDFEQSVEWGEKAAAAGSSTACINLGIAYRSRGNSRMAKSWFEKALTAGDPEAALELARMYMVSELENSRVVAYLRTVVSAKAVSEDSRAEAQQLLAEVEGA